MPANIMQDKNPRKKARMGNGPNRFKAAMMACGLSTLETAEWLGEGVATVQKWKSGDDAPDVILCRMMVLHNRIIERRNLDHINTPRGAVVMSDLLREWSE